MNKIFIVSAIFILGLTSIVLAAPTYLFQRGILPETSNYYDLGTSTRYWKGVYSDTSSASYFTATSTTSASTFSILNVLTRLGIATTTGTDTLNLVGDFNHNGSDVESIENNKSQAGALMFDGFTTNARAYYTLNQDIGTASTTLFIRFKVSPNPGANVGLLALSSSNTAAAAANGFGVFIDSTGRLAVRLFGNPFGNFRTVYMSEAILQSYANQIIDLVIVKRNLSTTDIPLVYINGILQTSSGSDSSGAPPNWNDTIVSTYAMIGARSASAIYNDRIYKAQVFNRALSENDIWRLRERGIANDDQWGNLTGQTSGTLTRGKRYVITTYVAGDDFTNIGASANATGVEFTTTGTTPTTWTNGSTLNEVGAILDANLEFTNPAITTVITDNSSNKYVGTVTATGVTQIKPTYQINNLFFDRTTGNVGIGTTTPISTLQVTDATNGSTITYGGKGVITSGNTVGALDTYSNDQSVGLTGVVSRIKTLAEADFVSSQAKTSLVFQTNTGVAGTLGEVMRLTSTGNVGIASTTPYALLSVTNTTASPSFIVEDSTSPDSTPFIIDASGNVGIGTTTPSAVLDVYRASALPALYVEGGTSGGIISQFSRRSGATTDIKFTGASGYPQITFGANGSDAYSIGYNKASYFSISEGSTIGTNERFVIRNTTGNVGIGTSTPGTLLQVNSSATSTISATVVSGSTRSTTLGGRIILQDVAGGTCTEITTAAGVIASKAVTCP